MLNYHKGKLNYKILKDEKVSFSNDDNTFSIVLLPEKTLNLYINFNPVNTGKSNIIFLCPSDALFTKSKIQECKIVTFESGSLTTSEKLIYLLFNSTFRDGEEARSIHKLRKSNGSRILEHFSHLEVVLLVKYSMKIECCLILIYIIYECVFEAFLEDQKDIINFFNLLNSNYRDKHLVSQYADLLRLPPKELLRAFKRRGYKKPSQIIRDRIVLEAKKLLIKTDLDVKQIGDRLGFEDPAYFARFFKKNTGMTASEFRNQFYKN